MDRDFATRRAMAKSGVAFMLPGEVSPASAGAATASDQRNTTLKAGSNMNDTRYDGIRFRHETVNGVGIHFIEAGDRAAPALILLHGFPSTSRMWDRLIPCTSPHFHVIAPGLSGIWAQRCAGTRHVCHTRFDNLAEHYARPAAPDRYRTLFPGHAGLWRPRRLSYGPCGTRTPRRHCRPKPGGLRCGAGAALGREKSFLGRPEANHDRLQNNLLSLDAARTRHLGSSPHPNSTIPTAGRTNMSC